MKTTWKLAPAMWLGLALAASAAEKPAADAPANVLTLMELLRMGGWLMYVLGALSVLGLALILYYAVVLRVRNIAPPAQVLRLRELLKERRMRDAREFCGQQPTALAAVTAAGRPSASSGSTSATRGSIAALRRLTFTRAAGTASTALRVASAPVPAVVGTAMNGSGTSVSAWPRPTTSR